MRPKNFPHVLLALALPLLCFFFAGCSSPYADINWHEIRVNSRLSGAHDDPTNPNFQSGLWYFKTYTAKENTSLGGIKLAKGESLIGVNTSNFLESEDSKSHWIIKPVYSEIKFSYSSHALVRKPGSRTFDLLEVQTGKITPTAYTDLIFSVSQIDTAAFAQNPAYPPTRGYERLVKTETSGPGDFTFVDNYFNPIVTINNVHAHHALQGGAIAIEHKIDGKIVLVVYDKKGTPLTPPIADYLIVFGQRSNYSLIRKICLLPVDSERGLYWPLAANGLPIPAPDGVIGIKPIFDKSTPRNPPKEPHALEAAVLWDTPEGELFAFIGDDLGDFKKLRNSRKEARWKDFRIADSQLSDSDIENSNTYPVRLAQDANGDIFMLPTAHKVTRSNSRIVDQNRFSDGLTELFSDISFPNWAAANNTIRNHNNATANRAWAASIRAAEERKVAAEQARINARIVAERKAKERQAANDALLKKVETAIKENRLQAISYDDLRAAYQATPNPSRRAAFEKAFNTKKAAEPKPRQIAQQTAKSTYSPSSGASNNAAVQATIQRHNAQMQQMEWRHKLENFNAGRGFTTPYSR